MQAQETATGVTLTATGSLNLRGMTRAAQPFYRGLITANPADNAGGSTFTLGANPNTDSVQTDFYTPLTKPAANFVVSSSGTRFFAGDSGTGPRFFGPGQQRLAGSEGPYTLGLVVPSGYTSGTSLNSTLVLRNRTFSSLGLRAGTYIWRLPSDTITLTVPDTIAPTVRIRAVQTDHSGAADPFIATFTFSEPVTGFDAAADISVTGGTAAAPRPLDADGDRYTALITPTGAADVLIGLVAGAAQDAAGNANAATAAADRHRVRYGVAPSVSISADKTAHNGTGTFTATFTFSETVTGFAVADIGVTGGTASNFSGSGAVYTATITPTDGNTDVVLNVAAGVAQGVTGNNNTAATAVTVAADSSAPSVSISADKTAHNGTGTFTATFTFSEAVTGFVVADIGVTGGTASNFSGSGAVYTATITPTNNSTDVTLNVAAGVAQDAAGNNNTAATAVTITADSSAPTVTITTDKTTHNGTGTFTATFTFSETVTGFAASDISLTGGTASNFSGTGAAYTATITPTDGNTDVVLNVAAGVAQDAAGNNNTVATTLTVTADSSAPTVTITTDKTAHNGTGAFTATFTFSETVTGFAASDISLTGGTASNFSGSGAAYTATITPTNNSTDVVLNVAAGVAQDAAGNNNTAATTVTVTADSSAPTVTISADKTAHNGTGTFTATFTFSETVTGFVVADIGVTGGTASNFSGTGAAYTATITPTNNSTDVALNVAAGVAQDAAGNNNTAATTVTVTADSSAPTVTISADKTAHNGTGTFTATFTFSETVTGFVVADIGVTGGTASNFSGTGAVYTATITPTNNSTDVALNVAAGVAQDAAGNNNTAATAVTITADSSAPTVTISTDKTAHNGTGTFTATFTFSETVTGFAASDISLTGGTASNFSSSGAVYTATITPTDGNTDVVLNVAAGVVQDAAGNNNTAATAVTVTADSGVPTVTITTDKTVHNGTGTFTATLTFSEAVTGFVLGDIGVTGGTASNFSGSGAAYTATITPTNNSTDVTLNVAAGVAQDAAGNNNTAATTAAVAADSSAPTVTITTDKTAHNGTGTFTATFTFGEAVTGFVLGDIGVTGGTASNFSGTGAAYTATITPTNNSTDVALNVAAGVAQDAAGNNNTVATTATVTADSSAPTVTITTDKTAHNGTGTFTATFTFSETVTGFVVADIGVTGGTASNFSGTGAVYTATITPADGNTDVALNVAAGVAQDAAGNNNTAAATVTVTADSDLPGVTISTDQTVHNGADPFTATFTFSEAVTGFVVADIGVTGGTASNFSGSGAVYTATITPADGNTNAVLTVAQGVATDTADNGNLAAIPVTVRADNIKPVVNIDAPSAHNGRAFKVTFTFSEPVTGFTAAGLNITGVAATAPMVSDTTKMVYRAEITPAGAAAAQIGLAAGAARDAAGNANAATAGLSVPYDPAPTVNITATRATHAGKTNPFSAIFTFSEPVTGFSAAGIHITGGAAAAPPPGDAAGRVYTAQITPAGAVDISIGLNAGAVRDTAGNPIAATAERLNIRYDAAPTVRIEAPASHDGSTPFNVSFIFSEPVRGFGPAGIRLANGALGALDGRGARYRATLTPTTGAAITLEVAANAAQDTAGNGNPAATRMIESRVVARTREIAGHLMLSRAQQLLNHAPELGALLEPASGRPARLSLNGGWDNLDWAFGVSLSEWRAKTREGGREWALGAANQALDLSLNPAQQSLKQKLLRAFHEIQAVLQTEATANTETKTGAAGPPALSDLPDLGQGGDEPGEAVPRAGEWDLWTQWYGAELKTGRVDSALVVGYAGLHYFLGDELLVGLMAQTDWAESEVHKPWRGGAKGRGWMLGPYSAGRLLPEQALFYELRLAYGQSSNDISPLGTYTDAFTASRWLASAKLSGRYELEAPSLRLRPAVSLTWFEERSRAYDDRLGNRIAGQTVSLGELRFGSGLEYSLPVGADRQLALAAGLTGVWNFALEHGALSAWAGAGGTEQLRARLNLGLRSTNTATGLQLAVGLFYDGIGVSDYESWGGGIKFKLPLGF